VFGTKSAGLEGTKVTPATTLIGGELINLRVGKSPKVLGLGHGTILGETGVSKFSPSKQRLGEDKIAGKLPKFKALETPTKDKIGDWEKINGASEEGN